MSFVRALNRYLTPNTRRVYLKQDWYYSKNFCNYWCGFGPMNLQRHTTCGLLQNLGL